ncbi:MAG: hypothetical protein OXQ94_16610 [Gemmatimonadota bacterium]|nr:hypothetical protein [Gemmatimonadota bacterium]
MRGRHRVPIPGDFGHKAKNLGLMLALMSSEVVYELIHTMSRL